jgi:hypothetical protein
MVHMGTKGGQRFVALSARMQRWTQMPASDIKYVDAKSGSA